MESNSEEKDFLEEQLYPEIISSEQKRATLLAAIAFLAALVISVYVIFFDEDIKSRVPSIWPLYVFSGMLILFFIRELIVRQVIKRSYERNRKIKRRDRFINIFIECSFPTLILILGLIFWQSNMALYSPAILLYFLIIILSTLSLDFSISLFAGLVCAIEYWFVVIITNNYSTHLFEASLLNSGYYHFGKGTLLIASGGLAGFVAMQLRKRITLSFEVLSERNRIINLFGQQVSPEIVTELITQKESIGSKRKYVCIMFLDIRGFTPFAEKLEPEELIDYQNKIFGFMIDVITDNYGVINQFLGDGYMATFGAPVSKGNDSQNAVNAAVNIINKVNELSEKGSIPQTRVGIGLHAGYIVAGNVGTTLRKQYSITGNTVIISARLEQLNKEYKTQLLISEEVHRAVSYENLNVNPRNLGEVKVKGREKPINLFKIM